MLSDHLFVLASLLIGFSIFVISAETSSMWVSKVGIGSNMMRKKRGFILIDAYFLNCKFEICY